MRIYSIILIVGSAVINNSIRVTDSSNAAVRHLLHIVGGVSPMILVLLRYDDSTACIPGTSSIIVRSIMGSSKRRYISQKY